MENEDRFQKEILEFFLEKKKEKENIFFGYHVVAFCLNNKEDECLEMLWSLRDKGWLECKNKCYFRGTQKLYSVLKSDK